MKIYSRIVVLLTFYLLTRETTELNSQDEGSQGQLVLHDSESRDEWEGIDEREHRNLLELQRRMSSLKMELEHAEMQAHKAFSYVSQLEGKWASMAYLSDLKASYEAEIQRLEGQLKRKDDQATHAQLRKIQNSLRKLRQNEENHFLRETQKHRLVMLDELRRADICRRQHEEARLKYSEATKKRSGQATALLAEQHRISELEEQIMAITRDLERIQYLDSKALPPFCAEERKKLKQVLKAIRKDQDEEREQHNRRNLQISKEAVQTKIRLIDSDCTHYREVKLQELKDEVKRRRAELQYIKERRGRGTPQDRSPYPQSPHPQSPHPQSPHPQSPSPQSPHPQSPYGIPGRSPSPSLPQIVEEEEQELLMSTGQLVGGPALSSKEMQVESTFLLWLHDHYWLDRYQNTLDVTKVAQKKQRLLSVENFRKQLISQSADTRDRYEYAPTPFPRGAPNYAALTSSQSQVLKAQDDVLRRTFHQPLLQPLVDCFMTLTVHHLTSPKGIAPEVCSDVAAFLQALPYISLNSQYTGLLAKVEDQYAMYCFQLRRGPMPRFHYRLTDRRVDSATTLLHPGEYVIMDHNDYLVCRNGQVLRLEENQDDSRSEREKQRHPQSGIQRSVRKAAENKRAKRGQTVPPFPHSPRDLYVLTSKDIRKSTNLGQTQLCGGVTAKNQIYQWKDKKWNRCYFTEVKNSLLQNLVARSQLDSVPDTTEGETVIGPSMDDYRRSFLPFSSGARRSSIPH